MVLIYEKGNETDFSNVRDLSLLSTSYKIFPNFFLSRLSKYVDEIIGDDECGFRRNRSITDNIFCIFQILEKTREDNETVHQLFIDFKRDYIAVMREVFYNVLIEFGVPMKLIGLINMCLNEMYNENREGKCLFDSFQNPNHVKQEYALLPLFLNFALNMPLGRAAVTEINGAALC
jgi:hypothetical protein